VVGYTAGAWNAETNVATVMSDQAHVWVEVLFPSFGWLSFEPTPGRLNPSTLAYTNPSVPCTSVPGGCGEATTTPAEPADLTTPSNPNGLPGQLTNLLTREQRGSLAIGSRGGPLPGLDTEIRFVAVSTETTSSRVVVGWIALGIVAAYLVLTPLRRVLRRRSRLRRAGREPRNLLLATYDVFTERAADLGYPRGPGETVQEYRRRLETTVPTDDGHLRRLSAMAQDAAYAPDPPDADHAARAASDADSAIRDLRRTTSLARRVTGLYRRG
jgi:transglutaminase-like putative cysteine protease